MEEMTQETKATAAEKQEARTFSQEEVNAIVQKRLAEEKGKAQKQQASPEADERDKVLQERENKLVLSERKFNAKQLLAEERLPTELIDFLDYSTDDTYKDSITKLSDIFSKFGIKDTGARIDTGLNHGSATKSGDDDFARILKE